MRNCFIFIFALLLSSVAHAQRTIKDPSLQGLQPSAGDSQGVIVAETDPAAITGTKLTYVPGFVTYGQGPPDGSTAVIPPLYVDTDVSGGAFYWHDGTGWTLSTAGSAFISVDDNNAIVLGVDGGIYVSLANLIVPAEIVAVMPDREDQSGDAIDINLTDYFDVTHPVTWSGTLPAGLAYVGNAIQGTLTAGAPEVAPSTITVTGTNIGGVAEQTFSWTVRVAEAYMSSGSGDWSVSGTWTGSPAITPSVEDTVTVSAGHTVTIPDGEQAAISGLAQAGVLQINGSLTLHGDLTRVSGSTTSLGPGSLLDLNGHDIIGAGINHFYTAGTVDDRATVTDTSAPPGSANDPGVITAPGNGSRMAIAYTDFSNLGNSVLGRAHGASPPTTSAVHCTFTNCGNLTFDETNLTANSGFIVEYCDFRDPRAGVVNYPMVYNSAATTTERREFLNCTWDGSAEDGNAVWARAQNATFQNCIINGFKLAVGNNDNLTIDGCFHNNDSQTVNFVGFIANGITGLTVRDSYLVCRSDNGHPMGDSSGLVFEDNVVECRNYPNINYILISAGASGSMMVRRNIWIGTGIAVTVTGSITKDIDVSRNTFSIVNGFDSGTANSGGTLKAPYILLTEQAGLLGGAGTREVYDNLLSDTSTDLAVDLTYDTVDQITYLDYNASYPAAPDYGPRTFVTAGVGPNDIAANPNFVNALASMSVWTQSIGEGVTMDDGIAALARLNTSSHNPQATVSGLLTFLRAGFKPTNAVLNAAGRTGDDIGAIDF